MSDWNREVIRVTLVEWLLMPDLRILIFDLGLDDSQATEANLLILHILAQLFRDRTVHQLEEWMGRHHPTVDVSTWRIKPGSMQLQAAASPIAPPTPSPPRPTTPPPPTINHDKAIEQFVQFMQPTSDLRVFRLVGLAKMGKSHLVAKVFPRLAERDFGARVAILDLRGIGILDLLHLASIKLGGPNAFPRFYPAWEEWTARPIGDAVDLQQALSNLSNAARDPEVGRGTERRLTSLFTSDLARLPGMTLLLFDAFDDAGPGIQDWLMRVFLSQTTHNNIRMVVAGRENKNMDPSSSYALTCCTYHLGPVTHSDAYITYCRARDIRLSEQTILAFAVAFDYAPGLFAEYTDKFVGGAHG